MGVEVRDRRMLEHDLRSAIARHEFELAYQPQARLDTREITGFEALLRWRHPQRGPGFARLVHSRRRGKWNDSTDRGMGAERGMRGSQRLDQSAQRRRERLGDAIA